MTLALNKIVSGGQTGADMGGLLAARDLGIETGGIAPKGWLTENGPHEALLRSFGLAECEERGYAARTRLNVARSDGTLLVGPHRNGGSRLTYEVATELKKPLLLIACPNPSGRKLDTPRMEDFRIWLERYEIQTLNVAGSRESESRGIAEFTRNFLWNALRDILSAKQ